MAFVQILIDDEAILRLEAAIEEAAASVEQTMYFIADNVQAQLRSILPVVALELGSRAGPGFPVSYRNHLARTIQEKVVPIVSNLGGGMVELNISFDSLGGYNELELGYHQGAMTDELDYQDFKSFRESTKEQLPSYQVQLPYEGQALYTGRILSTDDKQRRLDWWENAIVNRISSETHVWANWHRKAPEDFWHVPWSEVPTFEQVASRRVNEAWEPLGIAPEWVLLEDGMIKYAPKVEPVGFLIHMENVTRCVFQSIFDAVLLQVQEFLQSGGEFTRPFAVGQNIKSLPFRRTASGPRFSAYKAQLSLNAPNTAGCLDLVY